MQTVSPSRPAFHREKLGIDTTSGNGLPQVTICIWSAKENSQAQGIMTLACYFPSAISEQSQLNHRSIVKTYEVHAEKNQLKIENSPPLTPPPELSGQPFSRIIEKFGGSSSYGSAVRLWPKQQILKIGL